jgi:hypothetical protein
LGVDRLRKVRLGIFVPETDLSFKRRIWRRQHLLGVAEVRISASTHELCDKLIEAFREMKIQRIGTAKRCAWSSPLLWWSRLLQSFSFQIHRAMLGKAYP